MAAGTAGTMAEPRHDGTPLTSPAEAKQGAQHSRLAPHQSDLASARAPIPEQARFSTVCCKRLGLCA